MIRKPSAARTLRILLGIIVAIEPPAITPNKLANTNALAEPKKTASGLSVVPLIATVANWVLSPSSAKKIVVKVVNKSGIMIKLVETFAHRMN